MAGPPCAGHHSMAMTFEWQRVGFEPHLLLQSPDDVRARLHAILSDKVMRFNPYAVDDQTLIDCAGRATWQALPALTQMVIFHFKELCMIRWKHDYEGAFFTIGDSDELLHVSMSSLTDRLTYSATRSQVHVMVDDKPLTNRRMVERMLGKDYIVTHALMSVRGSGARIPAKNSHA